MHFRFSIIYRNNPLWLHFRICSPQLVELVVSPSLPGSTIFYANLHHAVVWRILDELLGHMFLNIQCFFNVKCNPIFDSLLANLQMHIRIHRTRWIIQHSTFWMFGGKCPKICFSGCLSHRILRERWIGFYRE